MFLFEIFVFRGRHLLLWTSPLELILLHPVSFVMLHFHFLSQFFSIFSLIFFLSIGFINWFFSIIFFDFQIEYFWCLLSPMNPFWSFTMIYLGVGLLHSCAGFSVDPLNLGSDGLQFKKTWLHCLIILSHKF